MQRKTKKRDTDGSAVEAPVKDDRVGPASVLPRDFERRLNALGTRVPKAKNPIVKKGGGRHQTKQNVQEGIKLIGKVTLEPLDQLEHRAMESHTRLAVQHPVHLAVHGLCDLGMAMPFFILRVVWTRQQSTLTQNTHTPVLVTPMPHVKSKYFVPFSVSIHVPLALFQTSFVCRDTPVCPPCQQHKNKHKKKKQNLV